MDAQLYAWSGTKWDTVGAQSPTGDAIAASSGFNVNAFLLGFSGSAWDRLRSSSLGATISAAAGALTTGAILYGWDGADYSRVSVEAAATPNLRAALYSGANAVSVAQANADTQLPTVYGMVTNTRLYGFDGNYWDRVKVAVLGTQIPTSQNALLVASCLQGQSAGNWHRVDVQSSGSHNLRVALYNGASVAVLDSAIWDGESGSQYGLMTQDRLYGYNGSTWDRLRSSSLTGTISASVGVLTVGAVLHAWDGSNYSRVGMYSSGAVKTCRAPGGVTSSGVLATDTNVKAAAGQVYWITVSDTAALAIELNDSTDDSGTDEWGIDLPAGGYIHAVFDPPLEFATGIYLDVSTATCKVTIGYL